MAGRIQGITVEIGGDTTKLQTALKGVDTEIRNTQSQLRDVDKLLKLDPGNTELLAQKHRLLGDAVKEAVVDQETWEATRLRRKETGVKWDKTHSLDHEHILSGLVKCPICGAGLVGTLRRRKNRKSGEYKDDFYYKCLHRKKIDETHFCNFRLVLSQDEINHQVEEIILDMVADSDFKDYMVRKIDEKVDVSSLEAEREQAREQLRQVMGAKKKLTEMLDVSDKHYDQKYQDMHDRLDILYDRISLLEDIIADIKAKISRAYGEKITANQLYKIFLNFDKMYFKMTDLEKKQFMREFIEEIELYSEKQEDGRILKQLSLGFPVFYEGSEGDTIRLHKENTVELRRLFHYPSKIMRDFCHDYDAHKRYKNVIDSFVSGRLKEAFG